MSYHFLLLGVGHLQQPLDVQGAGGGELVVARQGGVVSDNLLHLRLSRRRQQAEHHCRGMRGAVAIRTHKNHND